MWGAPVGVRSWIVNYDDFEWHVRYVRAEPSLGGPGWIVGATPHRVNMFLPNSNLVVADLVDAWCCWVPQRRPPSRFSRHNLRPHGNASLCYIPPANFDTYSSRPRGEPRLPLMLCQVLFGRLEAFDDSGNRRTRDGGTTQPSPGGDSKRPVERLLIVAQPRCQRPSHLSLAC